MNSTDMGDRPRRIYNPVQRDAATFLETSEETRGARTLAELEVAPGGKVTPHYHLTYSERFKVLEGQLTVEIDGVRQDLGPGDEAIAAAGSLHAWSNRGEERSVAQIELRPGSPGFEKALRVAYGLAADGLVLKNGVPRNPLHAALVLEMGEVRLPGAYAALERVLGPLARIARWRGVDRELERRYQARELSNRQRDLRGTSRYARLRPQRGKETTREGGAPKLRTPVIAPRQGGRRRRR